MTFLCAFKQVFKGTFRGSIDVAIKTMRVSKISQIELSKFKKEIIVSLVRLHVVRGLEV